MVLRFTLVVGVEEGAVFRPAAGRDRLAEEAISGLLASLESRGHARSAQNCARADRADQADVVGESSLGLAQNRPGAQETRNRCCQVDRGTLSTEGSSAGFAWLAGISQDACQEIRRNGFLCGADC